MKKSRQVAWIVVVLVLAFTAVVGGLILGQLVRMDGDAKAVCHGFLEERAGRRIDIADLKTSPVVTDFPEPLRKRHSTTCTYGDVAVDLESRPFKPWVVVRTRGLD